MSKPICSTCNTDINHIAAAWEKYCATLKRKHAKEIAELKLQLQLPKSVLNANSPEWISNAEINLVVNNVVEFVLKEDGI